MSNDKAGDITSIASLAMLQVGVMTALVAVAMSSRVLPDVSFHTPSHHCCDAITSLEEPAVVY